MNKTIVRRFKYFKSSWGLTLLALPTICYIFVFSYVPLYGLMVPFKDYNFSQGFWGSPWIGLKNFEYLLNSDLIGIVRNTIVMNGLFIIINVIVGVTVALLLFELGKRASKTYQTLLFLPYFISWIVVSYAVYGFLDPELGIVNKIIAAYGGEQIMFYNEPKYWLFILVAVNAWKLLGYGALMYFAALMGIDSEYYEAAKLDGASRFQQAIHISIPMIRPIIIIMVILSIGNIFYADIGLFYSVPKDSAMLYPATDVIDTYVYRALRVLGDFGMSSAAGLVQSICGFTLVILSNYVIGKISKEDKIF
ncbi:ABC transporter permease subunit [Paenibacillus eucommiae]|uniref:Aldouronate transport system permease protein n=1 Tax=Paenibacillus eucommiae TaxID=1355755 RepID=A0ABS4IWH5_9BACL|nr:ABC transporter permease subunit [Paenibacillus eucommiae]MBP1991942.1 putative aldouronate transport system permease protein [Paenibacillus eucommiae]